MKIIMSLLMVVEMEFGDWNRRSGVWYLGWGEGGGPVVSFGKEKVDEIIIVNTYILGSFIAILATTCVIHTHTHTK